LWTDEIRKRDTQTEAVVKSESSKVCGKTRLRGGHSKIGEEGEAEAAANRGALNRSDDRSLGREESNRLIIEVDTTLTAGE
jgi:hypothetical protein